MFPKKSVGVLLAGGLNKRLWPWSHFIPKAMLPLVDRPVIYYSIRSLALNGIRDIAIVAEQKHLGVIREIIEYFKIAKEFNVTIEYIDDGEEKKGPGSALLAAYDWVKSHDPALIIVKFADNYFMGLSDHLGGYLSAFDGGGMTVVKAVPNPEVFGVLSIDEDGEITQIVEKPESPQGNLILTGLYICDAKSFELVTDIRPHKDGEYYITDLLNIWLDRDLLSYTIYPDYWSDIGTPEGLAAASYMIARRENRDWAT